MSELRIVTDSAADMPPDWAEEFDIHVLPVNMEIGGKSYLPGIDLDKDKFYKLMSIPGVFPKTSLPSPQQVMDYYSKIANTGDRILSVHVASRMSGTFHAVQMAAEELQNKFKIYPFDSGNGSAGLAFMCKEAREMDQKGENIQKILNKLESIKKRIVIILTVDSLEYARRSGRVSALQQKLSFLLQVKPIIILKDGMLQMAEKVRTRQKSIEKVLELVKKKVGEQKVNIAIVQAEDMLAAQEIMRKVKDSLNIKELIMTDLSISVVANLGPRTVGIIAYPVNEDQQ
jgi:DegV family protein with EDD domain